jgi:hypothetical protein
MSFIRELLRDYFRWVGRSRSAQQLGHRTGVGIIVLCLALAPFWLVAWLIVWFAGW